MFKQTKVLQKGSLSNILHTKPSISERKSPPSMQLASKTLTLKPKLGLSQNLVEKMEGIKRMEKALAETKEAKSARKCESDYSQLHVREFEIKTFQSGKQTPTIFQIQKPRIFPHSSLAIVSKNSSVAS